MILVRTLSEDEVAKAALAARNHTGFIDPQEFYKELMKAMTIQMNSEPYKK